MTSEEDRVTDLVADFAAKALSEVNARPEDLIHAFVAGVVLLARR